MMGHKAYENCSPCRGKSVPHEGEGVEILDSNVRPERVEHIHLPVRFLENGPTYNSTMSKVRYR